MQFSTLKDLEKLIKLCKKHGISKVETSENGLSFEFRASNETDEKRYLNQSLVTELNTTPAPGGLSADMKVLPDDFKIEAPHDLTEEQRLFYSSEGLEEAKQ